MNDCEFPSFPHVLKMMAKSQRIPLLAQLELTARCNFNCRMCYIHMDDKRIKEIGQELSTDEWLRIAKETKELGTLYLSLTGGEVFTRPDFQELYTKLSEMGFLIQIMSNISMIDENVMKWLSKRPPYSINTTLYGSNNDIYRSVCKVEHGFDRFDHALNLLQAANIPVAIKSTLIKDNENDLKNMYEYAANHGVRLNATFGVVKSVRGAISEAYTVRRTRSTLPIPMNISDSKKDFNEHHGPIPHHPKYLDDCGAYETSYNITWDGFLSLCGFMSEPCINIRNTSVAHAWKTFLHVIDEIKKPEKCNNCKYEEYCVRCPGILSAECGSYDSINEEFCEDAKCLYNIYNKGESYEKEI